MRSDMLCSLGIMSELPPSMPPLPAAVPEATTDAIPMATVNYAAGVRLYRPGILSAIGVISIVVAAFSGHGLREFLVSIRFVLFDVEPIPSDTASPPMVTSAPVIATASPTTAATTSATDSDDSTAPPSPWQLLRRRVSAMPSTLPRRPAALLRSLTLPMARRQRRRTKPHSRAAFDGHRESESLPARARRPRSSRPSARC